MSLVPLPSSIIPFLEPYLPREKNDRPFVTLTWAQSIDSRIAAAPGTQTKISHPETKTMTHYLRAYHDAILVGIGTVLADDPKLTCRYGNFSKIRPVVVDPAAKWDYSKSTISTLCQELKALAPIILTNREAEPLKENVELLQSHGGSYRALQFLLEYEHNWIEVLRELHACDIKSVMIEGGAKVINSLLVSENLVDSVIVTIGPVFLGKQGVEVSPPAGLELQDVAWWRGTTDSVMAARLITLPEVEDLDETTE
ncbi:hypothetical protein PUMCH_004072 [Australozyma saopauloensis]|uniref:2,5-diamino-6-ribosylamino-4(3H)-pyrimidinone 5'-phosphate reductase n=1 Tax=Australozyma saopauloensis TaxID=291208 RepID=A0AAX4HFP3_9ASCO|nr:hypothetical protein PUMCH_004072 [[Candida] saopauloensis]